MEAYSLSKRALNIIECYLFFQKFIDGDLYHEGRVAIYSLIFCIFTDVHFWLLIHALSLSTTIFL